MMLINTKKFSKTTTLHEPSLTDLQVRLFTPNCTRNLHMKNSPEKYVKKDDILEAPIRIYMKNAIVFSQSDMRKFFM